MGCDIHSYLEKQQADGKWACIQDDPLRGRNYRLYGLLANVRGGPAVFEPRGIPDNLSPEVASVLAREGDDHSLHSHSWLTYREVLRVRAAERTLGAVDEDDDLPKKLEQVLEKVAPHLYPEERQALMQAHAMILALAEREADRDEHGYASQELRRLAETMAKLEAEGTPTRVVFWFDS